MAYTMEERRAFIIASCLKEKSKNPIEIFDHLIQDNHISVNGPEHHMLDGACILTAFANAGGKINLEEGLNDLCDEGMRMPGAMCGLWGVCGACSSVGAALSVIDHTGPLTPGDDWGNHMILTSNALKALSQVGGPRCCKRDGYLSLLSAISYINEHYPVILERSPIHCQFQKLNRECKEECPFYH